MKMARILVSLFLFFYTQCISVYAMEGLKSSQDCVVASHDFTQLCQYLIDAPQDSYVSLIPRDVRNLVVNYFRGNTYVERWFNLMQYNPEDITLEAPSLLSKDASLVNMRCSNGDPALLYMTMHENIPMLQLLLTHGADIDLPNNSGATALIRAAYRNKLKAAQFLINNGADLDACKMSGKIALDVALECKHMDIAQLLRDAAIKKRNEHQDGGA